MGDLDFKSVVVALIELRRIQNKSKSLADVPMLQRSSSRFIRQLSQSGNADSDADEEAPAVYTGLHISGLAKQRSFVGKV